ncbi:uncharacterized protein PAC_13697 [Phialocephala subalpina]|uniref:Heterokaryon incompatibility domain-containing protein n=1 Tax=Phialocephala subalpina TaxID=576137 RepID=A0A1L7XFI1_9HELO|nr:uncharacterized protein PAC_13697 [Phialocephala subalpina]
MAARVLDADKSCTNREEHGSTLQQDDLCLECQSVFDLWHEREVWNQTRKGHPHHNILDLETCICPTCRMLFNSFLDSEVQAIRSQDSLVRSNVNVRVEAIGLFAIQLKFPGLDFPLMRIMRSGCIAISHSSNGKVKLGTIQPATDCEESWKLMSKWLQTCRESHPACAKRFMERRLPTRLISLGDTGKDTKIKIVPSQLLSNDIEYVTLSHCWGRKSFTTLTKDNYPDFLSQIPATALSKTFRDAIHATRKLGFKYLWIDSLCIFQGDERDWQHEAALMVYVYSNSALNLAAADAPDGETGLFFKRDTTRTLALRVSLPETSGSVTSSVWNCTTTNLTWELMTNCVLDRRAWTYQERFLPPSTLIFAHSQTAWECRTMKAHEIFPESTEIPDSLTIGQLSHDLLMKTSLDVVRGWGQIIANYTNRNLTFSRDKLIALAGVARILAPQFGPRYLAGLWEKDMAINLMWYVEDIEMPYDGTTASYRAPSWSWASTDNNAWLALELVGVENYNTWVEVVQADTTFSGDQFGEVSDGYVRLRCRDILQGSCHGGRLTSFEPTEWSGLNLSSKSTMKVYPDRIASEVEGDVVFVPMLEGVDDESGIGEIWGMILTNADPGAHRFRRIGAFKIKEIHYSGDFEKHRDLTRTDMSGSESIEWENRSGFDQEGKPELGNQGPYIITII